MLILLVKGLILGFSIAAPVGPIGVLCIRRTLANGRLAGFASGMGAATADATYGFIAAFGLTFLSDLLISQQTLLRIVGGLFLLYLGIKTLLSIPAEDAAKVETTRSGLPGMYLSTFGLTLTNPMTILSFLAIFAGAGIASTAGDYGSAALLVLGVFMGSAAWWLLLSGGVSLLRQRFNTRVMLWVNRLSGVIILLFALRILLVG
ncbi:MAG TPA: LysE family translocator [Phototrophicaceae bacterium]|nr:LysE family translocator [Phototrophicaceae bacterium]